MYSLIARWTILPGSEDKALAALRTLSADVEKNEPDTLLYQVWTPDFSEKSLPTAPSGEVIFIEGYRNKDAFEKHIKGPILTSFMKNHHDLFLTNSGDGGQLFVTLEILSRVAGFRR